MFIYVPHVIQHGKQGIKTKLKQKQKQTLYNMFK